MSKINIQEAKTHLSRLVEGIESGAETEIVIARNGKPVARLVPLAAKPIATRLGIAEGLYQAISLDAFNALDGEIEQSFGGVATENGHGKP